MADDLDDALAEVRELYFQECSELLADAAVRLSRLKDNLPELNQDEVNAIFRAVHSVKGGGAPWGLTEITGFAHVYESLLGEIREGTTQVTADSVEIMLRVGAGTTRNEHSLLGASRNGGSAHHHEAGDERDC